MLEFKNVQVSGLESAVIASRYAMMTEMPDLENESVRKECFEKGLNRAKALAKNGGGSGHTSFRKGIRVEFDMKYTQYITKQCQRYSFFDYISSSSMMHRITKMDFSKCVNKYVSRQSIEQTEEWKKIYNHIVENKVETYVFNNGLRNFIGKTYNECVYIAFMLLLSNAPMGTELFVHVNTNYEQLATMYKQRENHKLIEDWGAFKDMVKSLPYAEDLIICKK